MVGDPHPVVLQRLALPQPVFTAAMEVGGCSVRRAGTQY